MNEKKLEKLIEKYGDMADNTAYDEQIRDIDGELYALKQNNHNKKSISKNLDTIREYLKILAMTLNDTGLFEDLVESD